MAEKNGKKRRKKIGKPNRVIYNIGFGILLLYFRIFVGTRFKFDRSGLNDLKSGPALIISPHISGIDHIVVGWECKKYLPTFVLSEHLFSKPLIRFILTRFAHAIPKKMFYPDAGTIMGILRAKSEGNVIVLFPEGRMNAVAHTYPVTPGTAELVKKLSVPVYCVTGTGAALADPKWYKGFRRGLVTVKAERVFTEDEIKNLSVGDISERIDKAIYHDDEKAADGRRYPAKDTVKGLDGILYRCPECNNEFCLTAENSRISCSECGFSTELKDDFRFTNGRLKSVNEWFYWQIDCLDKNTVFDEDIKIGAVGPDGNMDLNAGKGHLRLDKERLTVTGEVFGEDVSYSCELVVLGGTPYTPNKEFDIYCKGKLLYLQPPDVKTVVKHVTFIDKICAENRGIKLYRF